MSETRETPREQPGELLGEFGTLQERLLQRIERFREQAVELDALATTRTSLVRLDQAMERLKGLSDKPAPLHVALLGGTGSGKSTLFNTLLQRPGASPTSVTRLHTRRPYVAVAEADRPALRIPTALDAVYIPSDHRGIVLCDTPDIDGSLTANHELTRQVIEACDMIVYVTDNQKYSNDAVNAEVRRWGERKRWYLVLNKMDLIAEDDRVRLIEDFDRKIQAIGFQSADDVRFAISAHDPDAFDFARLRDAIFRQRSAEHIRLLPLDGFLRYARHAVDETLLQPVRELQDDLREQETIQRQRLIETYRQAMKTPEVQTAFHLVLREKVWQSAGNHCGLILWPAVWLRCRLSALFASYSVTRGLARGMSIFGLINIAVGMAAAVVRGWLPLRHVTEALGPGFRKRLEDIRRDCLRILEDRGLNSLVREAQANADVASLTTREDDHPTVRQLDSLLKRLMLRNADEEVLQQLSSDVDRIGMTAVKRSLGGFRGYVVVLFCSLFPMGALGWAGYRFGMAWWNERYLTLNFYSMAAVLILIAYIMGYLFLAGFLRIRERDQELTSFDELDESRVTSSLRLATDRLDALLKDARQVRQGIDNFEDTLRQMGGLSRADFGATCTT